MRIENQEEIVSFDFMSGYENHGNSLPKTQCSKQWQMGLSCRYESLMPKRIKIQDRKDVSHEQKLQVSRSMLPQFKNQ